jgi:aldose 1-epimerase
MYEIRTIDTPAKGLAVFYNGKKVADVLYTGATLNYLSFDDRNLIDGYDRVSLQAYEWSRSAILFPFPNRLRDGKYSFEGKDYAFPINEPDNQNALHGFLYSEDFALKKLIASPDMCSITLAYEYDKVYDFYPFSFSFDVTFQIESNKLTALFEITNTGESDLPFGFGWHPYFMLTEKVDEMWLQFPSGEQLELDDRQLPTGQTMSFDLFEKGNILDRRKFDDGFHIGKSHYVVKMRSEAGKELQLKIENQPYLQVFTPDDRKRIAIEPMSSGIDVFNSKVGISVLVKGQSEIFKTEIQFK